MRDGLGIGEFIKSHMFRAPGGDDEAIGPDGFAVGVENRDLDVRVLVRGIQKTHSFMAGKLRLGSVTPTRDIPLGDRPMLTANGRTHALPPLRGVSNREGLRAPPYSGPAVCLCNEA